MNPNVMLTYVQAGVAIVGGVASVIAGAATIINLDNQQQITNEANPDQISQSEI